MIDTKEREPIAARRTGCCSDIAPLLTPEAAKQASDDLQLLAHPIRLQILAMLAQSTERVCVCDLEAALPVKQPTVSHHLRLLRNAGLIDCVRDGLWAYYFVQRPALDTLRQRIGQQLAAFG